MAAEGKTPLRMLSRLCGLGLTSTGTKGGRGWRLQPYASDARSTSLSLVGCGPGATDTLLRARFLQEAPILQSSASYTSFEEKKCTSNLWKTYRGGALVA